MTKDTRTLKAALEASGAPESVRNAYVLADAIDAQHPGTPAGFGHRALPAHPDGPPA